MLVEAGGLPRRRHSWLALACTLRSWFLVKARALDRAKVLVGEKTEDEVKLPKSKWGLRSSWVWDTAAAWAIVLGAVWLAVGLVLER
jgi:hypothetical protein